MSAEPSVRIDKWLWAARFFKTRSLAQTQIERGRIKINNDAIKPARGVKVGDIIKIDTSDIVKTVLVLGLSESRGPAPVAQQLYSETQESVTQREQSAQQRKFASEPASQIKGRPTKQDRRSLAKVRGDDF
jgi:ribosome-associated heat shock protein Hsp15